MGANVHTPVRTSDRKRPNKTFIQQMADFRGHMTENEKTQLATLNVKNVIQRVNNKAMSENKELTTEQNIAMQNLMEKFVRDIKQVLTK